MLYILKSQKTEAEITELAKLDKGLGITNYGLRITDYGLRITDHGL